IGKERPLVARRDRRGRPRRRPSSRSSRVLTAQGDVGGVHRRVRDARPEGRDRGGGAVSADRGLAQLGTAVSCLTARAARPSRTAVPCARGHAQTCRSQWEGRRPRVTPPPRRPLLPVPPPPPLPTPPAATEAQEQTRLPAPRAQFGHDIGADYVLPNYRALVAYWQKL